MVRSISAATAQMPRPAPRLGPRLGLSRAKRAANVQLLRRTAAQAHLHHRGLEPVAARPHAARPALAGVLSLRGTVQPRLPASFAAIRFDRPLQRLAGRGVPARYSPRPRAGVRASAAGAA